MVLERYKSLYTTLSTIWIGLCFLLLAIALIAPEQRSWMGVVARVLLALGALGMGTWYLAVKKRLAGVLLVATGVGLLITALMGYGLHP